MFLQFDPVTPLTTARLLADLMADQATLVRTNGFGVCVVWYNGIIPWKLTGKSLAFDLGGAVSVLPQRISCLYDQWNGEQLTHLKHIAHSYSEHTAP